jgi:DNA-binding ferritin-like protein (Dps family)
MHAKGEVNDYLTHLKLAAKNPDVRWAALEILAGGCDSFAGNLADPAFDAMGALAQRSTRAKKADVWKAWMAKKLDEAKVLGQASYLFDQGYAIGQKGQKFWNQAIEVIRPAYKMALELRDKCEPDDKDFYDVLIRDMKQTYNEDAPKPKSKAPESKPGEKGKIEEPKL